MILGVISNGLQNRRKQIIMSELIFDVILDGIGAILRYFFTILSKKAKLVDYFDDEFSSVNMLIGILFVYAVFGCAISMIFFNR